MPQELSCAERAICAMDIRKRIAGRCSKPGFAQRPEFLEKKCLASVRAPCLTLFKPFDLVVNQSASLVFELPAKLKRT